MDEALVENPTKPKIHDPKYFILFRKVRYTQTGNPPTMKALEGQFVVARDPDKRAIKTLQKTMPGTFVAELRASEINKLLIP